MVQLSVHFSDFLLSSHPKSTFISMLHITVTGTRLFLGNRLFIMYLYSTLYPSTIPPKSINQNKYYPSQAKQKYSTGLQNRQETHQDSLQGSKGKVPIPIHRNIIPRCSTEVRKKGQYYRNTHIKNTSEEYWNGVLNCFKVSLTVSLFPTHPLPGIYLGRFC